MKKTLEIFFVSFIVIICLMDTIHAQSVKEVSGKYISTLSDQDVLLLMEDGKFVARESGFTIKGIWKLGDGNEVRLKWSDFGEPLQTRAKIKIKGSKLVDQDGVEWVKENK